MFQKLKKEMKNVIEKSVKEISSKMQSNETPSYYSPTHNTPKRAFVKESFQVVGTDYYMKNIEKLRIANPEYRKRKLPAMQRVYRYTYVDRPVKLNFEPENVHDRNAIKVYIAGENVGYISSYENEHVGNILRYHEIKYIYSSFQGGEYKIMSEDNSIAKVATTLRINIHLGYI